MPISHNRVVDFDWSLNMTMSSNSVAAINKPNLHLKLKTMQPDGSKKEAVIELSEAELDNLLQEMDKIEKATLSLAASDETAK